MSTARFSKSLTNVSANNIVTLLDLTQELAYYEQFKADNIVDHSIVLEDLQCKVGLFSLLEADWPNENALASESAMEAARAKILKEGQKIYLELYIAKGNGPWELQGEEILQNKNGLEQPWALMAPWFSTNETALLGEDLKIGVKVANKAQGVGGLKGTDYLRIFGTWRKQTKIESKKKDDGIEALHDRISALETLLSTFGAPSASLPGTNGLVPAPPAGGDEFLLRGDREWENPSRFATPAQITTAINDLVGNTVADLNTLAELGAAIANDPNFAASVATALLDKVSKTSTETIDGIKTFTSRLQIQSTAPGFWLDESDASYGIFLVLASNILQIQRRPSGFLSTPIITVLTINLDTFVVTLPQPTSTVQIAGVKVLAARETGWSVPTGALNKAAAFNADTATISQLSQRYLALETAARNHGLIGG
ncbi:hypothetical protein QUB75_27020 [Microcoleus sp. K1-B6]|uniref:hypothetical protein n=1 Tax=unclassified Microcoleus TaxID=2642155 RepID=UPI002FD5FC67